MSGSTRVPTPLKIDFVSDIACPWCAIGLAGLGEALQTLSPEIEADITAHPFELNPDMPRKGLNRFEYLGEKYGMGPDQVREANERVSARAASVGFVINTSPESRNYNTFDAHRLLAWAGEEGRQLELKRRLFALNFTELADLGDHEALAVAAQDAGLDGRKARAVLASDAYAEQVRSEEALWQSRGISSVPATIVNDRYLISGGVPPEEFVRQLRAIAASTSGNA